MSIQKSANKLHLTNFFLELSFKIHFLRLTSTNCIWNEELIQWWAPWIQPVVVFELLECLIKGLVHWEDI